MTKIMFPGSEKYRVGRAKKEKQSPAPAGGRKKKGGVLPCSGFFAGEHVIRRRGDAGGVFTARPQRGKGANQGSSGGQWSLLGKMKSKGRGYRVRGREEREGGKDSTERLFQQESCTRKIYASSLRLAVTL